MRKHTGRSIAIAGVAAFGFAAWGAVVAVTMWISLTIYAIARWIGDADHPAYPLTVLLLMVANVTLFALTMALGMYAIGRPMRYRKRRKRDAEQLSLDLDEG
jgi:hypothetical protein